MGEKISYEGTVTKLSGGKMFGGNKWDSRTLRLESRELIYLDKGKEKGRVALDGSQVAFVDEDEYTGHPHAFSIQTAANGSGGKHDGRRYVFQCENDRECVKWIQQIKYSMSAGGIHPLAAQGAAFGVTPGIPACGLGQVVDQLYSNAAQWVQYTTLFLLQLIPFYITIMFQGGDVYDQVRLHKAVGFA